MRFIWAGNSGRGRERNVASLVQNASWWSLIRWFRFLLARSSNSDAIVFPGNLMIWRFRCCRRRVRICPWSANNFLVSFVALVPPWERWTSVMIPSFSELEVLPCLGLWIVWCEWCRVGYLAPDAAKFVRRWFGRGWESSEFVTRFLC
jgi:hypothetical protein